MNIIARFVSLVAIAVGVLLLAAPASAALIRFQAPCGAANDPCLGVAFNEPLPKSIRSFSFRAPSAGRAVVTFHGSTTCFYNGTPGGGVVDIVTQIGTDPNATPTAGAPGGLRHQIRILGDPDYSSDSFIPKRRPAGGRLPLPVRSHPPKERARLLAPA